MPYLVNGQDRIQVPNAHNILAGRRQLPFSFVVSAFFRLKSAIVVVVVVVVVVVRGTAVTPMNKVTPLRLCKSHGLRRTRRSNGCPPRFISFF